jgi:hypothetical protein
VISGRGNITNAAGVKERISASGAQVTLPSDSAQSPARSAVIHSDNGV